MATSTHPIISCTNINSFSTKSSSSPGNFSRRPSQIFLNPNPRSAARRGDVIKIRCAAASSEGRENPPDSSLSEAKLDRRNVLLGLGGLYGAYNLGGGGASNPFALADPVPLPDVSNCGPATISFSTCKVPYRCCPPITDTTNVDYYEIPCFSKLNVRPAAHAVDDEYLEKYKTAIKLMKELPPSDPRSFDNQAKVHCAYCNGAYQLAGQPYQIHFNWFFFPFHRWYLYFFERIMQSMINDPTFTLPYWNWDNQPGMTFPRIFDDDKELSPLYDQYRNQLHTTQFHRKRPLSKAYVMDLAYSSDEILASDPQKVNNNLAIMYRQMITNAPCPLLFFGKPLRADNGQVGSSGMGTIENIPHNSVHRWVGDPRSANHEDMGNFYSAANDPVFYSLHSNVDRMWSIWKSLGGKRKDITDPDWLQTEFLFYDETKTPVKVKVKDCLDNEKLGYTFQDMPIRWKHWKPTKKRTAKLRSLESVPVISDVLPAPFRKILTFHVTRSTSVKDTEEELLNFDLVYDDTKFIRFDVFLNEDEDVNTKELDRMEYSGSFANLPHVHEGGSATPKKTTFTLAISELIQDLGLKGEDKVLVALVPKAGGKFVTVDKAYINTMDC
ncbi:PREDICTED: catechol oxidase B, chloroplastic-like [Ipomoea nil]|uniref:catechol oxidase B, chloroplastic-like n=1 Tax=Ipomoea nil TaxID=35883 RepID=UPI000900E1D1|nr:PREDICTED: catechol oxidase B, chloroplastic-like [Ipomoea nil]